MASIFTKIIRKEIPAYIVHETDDFIAFLDAFPLVKGHVLIVPKQEIDYVFDLNDELLSNMMLYAKKIAKAQKMAIDCKRIGIAVIGLEVPHCHVHLVPMNTMNDINFTQPKISVEAAEMEKIKKSIQQSL